MNMTQAAGRSERIAIGLGGDRETRRELRAVLRARNRVFAQRSRLTATEAKRKRRMDARS